MYQATFIGFLHCMAGTENYLLLILLMDYTLTISIILQERKEHVCISWLYRQPHH